MELEALIHARLDGEITPEQHAQLEARLREDWQARRLYLELADQHARLLQQPQLGTGRLLTAGGFAGAKNPRFRVWRRLLPPLAAAAGVALAFSLWLRPASPVEATANGVALLGASLDAEFEGGERREGETLAPGRLRLARGLAQIEFFSGATVLLEGGAELEILSAWEARCHGGRLRVRVPPAAKGFILHAPDMKLEDLGTEFALNVKGRTSAVEVVEGEVIAHTADSPASLTQGMRLGSSEQAFLPVREISSLVRAREQSRFEAWQQGAQQRRTDPRLIAYYTFKRWEEDRWERLVNNFTEPRRPNRAGGIVGARWTRGRWPEKQALEFKRPGDRVRLNLDGRYPALTLACWVKVDSVDKKYSGLLLTDGYENGEPHWQIYEDGSLMFSLMYRPAEPPVKPQQRGKWNQMHFSKPVFTADRLGRWHHLAVTCDAGSGEVVQYFDGVEVGRGIHELHQPGRDLVFGPCELGNWGLPTEGHQFPIRNLNGAMDEFAIYSKALKDEEILQLYEQGKPE